MRIPKALSPTSLAAFYKDRESFYVQRLSDAKITKEPQTPPMAAGSAFDAFVKSFLVNQHLARTDPRFVIDDLFPAQVEEHNRVEAWEVGQYLFDCYKNSGALSDLITEINLAVDPQFELEITGRVSADWDFKCFCHKTHECQACDENGIVSVPFLGKPDASYKTSTGFKVVLDWKVNGFYSKSMTSPKPGYVRCRGGKHSNPHKDAFIERVDGLPVNSAMPLELIDETWASQIAIYAWLMGEKVGGQFLACIDQLCNIPGPGKYPGIRVAAFRSFIGRKFQEELFERAAYAWYLIVNNHIFDDLTVEESRAKCEQLDAVYANGDSKEDALFRMVHTNRPY